MNSDKRKGGGSYRYAKELISRHAKEGKDRSKAKQRKNRKRVKK